MAEFTSGEEIEIPLFDFFTPYTAQDDSINDALILAVKAILITRPILSANVLARIWNGLEVIVSSSSEGLHGERWAEEAGTIQKQLDLLPRHGKFTEG